VQRQGSDQNSSNQRHQGPWYLVIVVAAVVVAGMGSGGAATVYW